MSVTLSFDNLEKGFISRPSESDRIRLPGPTGKSDSARAPGLTEENANSDVLTPGHPSRDDLLETTSKTELILETCFLETLTLNVLMFDPPDQIPSFPSFENLTSL